MDQLIQELREAITQACDLDKALVESMTDDDPIVGPNSPLGLDSLDALEIVTAVQKKYGVRIDNRNTSMQVLASLKALAAFVNDHRGEVSA